MTYATGILAHYERHWLARGKRCRFTRGPISDLHEDFGVFCFPPRPSETAWTYATVAMSTPSEPDPLELFMLSPRASEEIVELLYMTAHYHRTGARLGCAHTVRFGRPWLAGATATCGYTSKPYLDGPAFEWFEPDPGVIVQICWLIPITEAERDFAVRNGVDAIEEAFERANFNYLDPHRTSVCAPPPIR